jgi:hypothetical protein
MVEIITDRMLTLWGCWYDIIVLNMHVPNEDKSGNTKELEQVFDNFLKYHMKILLWDFNTKVGREDTFKPTIRNESLHEINNDNGVRKNMKALAI